MRLKLAAAAWDYTAEIVRDIPVTVANVGSRLYAAIAITETQNSQSTFVF